MMDVFAYLDRSIATFERDSPSNEYQRGHLDALKVARAELATLDRWQPMADAPLDGTMVWLLVDYGAYGEHPLADANRAATLGFNNHRQDQDWPESRWQFVGWNWEQDCFCNHERSSPSEGFPVAWRPIGFDLEQEEAEPGSPVTGCVKHSDAAVGRIE